MCTSSDPIIVRSSSLAQRSVQFWGTARMGKLEYDCCMAHMTERAAGVSLIVDELCPADWLPQVWAAFVAFRSGLEVVPTHTAVWSFGKPVFEPILSGVTL